MFALALLHTNIHAHHKHGTKSQAEKRDREIDENRASGCSAKQNRIQLPYKAEHTKSKNVTKFLWTLIFNMTFPTTVLSLLFLCPRIDFHCENRCKIRKWYRKCARHNTMLF